MDQDQGITGVTGTVELKQRYQAAFDSFLEKVKADETILAVYLFGSLAQGDLWEKSDLDVFVVTKDERPSGQTLALVEHGITFHCDVFSRSRFRRIHERLLRGSVTHQVFTSGKPVYARDESLAEYYQDMAHVGQRDRELLALRYGIEAVASLHDVEKALYAHADPAYAFVWLLEAVRSLACIETALQGQVIRREVIRQALASSPAVFRPLFCDLLEGPKDLQTMQQAASEVDAFLLERAEQVFGPILNFLAAAGEVCGASEISRHFDQRVQLENGDFRLICACEWLVAKGFLQKVCAPLKLTSKSRVVVDEPAYFFAGNDRPQNSI